jgi:hypothetical protein
MGMISPNDLQQAAEEAMLDGRKAKSYEDWVLCANFWACNVLQEAAEPICILMVRMFDAPISEEDVKEIVAYQINAK